MSGNGTPEAGGRQPAAAIEAAPDGADDEFNEEELARRAAGNGEVELDDGAVDAAERLLDGGADSDEVEPVGPVGPVEPETARRRGSIAANLAGWADRKTETLKDVGNPETAGEERGRWSRAVERGRARTRAIIEGAREKIGSLKELGNAAVSLGKLGAHTLRVGLQGAYGSLASGAEAGVRRTRNANNRVRGAGHSVAGYAREAHAAVADMRGTSASERATAARTSAEHHAGRAQEARGVLADPKAGMWRKLGALVSEASARSYETEFKNDAAHHARRAGEHTDRRDARDTKAKARHGKAGEHYGQARTRQGKGPRPGSSADADPTIVSA